MVIWADGVSSDDVYFYFKDIAYTVNGNFFYQQDNWVKKIQGSFAYSWAIPDEINIIKSNGGAIWLTASGDICYRFSPLGKVHIAPIAKINLIFSNFLNCNFRISQSIPKLTILKEQIKKLNDNNKLTLSINQLQLVEGEAFNPRMEQEFYQNQNDGLIYRNTFKPSNFLQLSPILQQEVQAKVYAPIEGAEGYEEKTTYYTQNEPNKSITLQYLYYLCGYKKDRFTYLVNWLASFFKNLSTRSNTILVLYGNSQSGVDILFNSIITPLFGQDYTLKITNNTLKSKHEFKSIDKKLFYDLNKLSKPTVDNEKVASLLQNLLPDSQKFAQVLITTEEPSLPYNSLDNYTVFHVAKMIEDMYVPSWFNGSEKTKLSKDELIDAISQDLQNFATILKLYPKQNTNDTPFPDDDKKLILSTLEEKLEAFVHAIKNIDTDYFKPIENQNEDSKLYEELQEHFSKNLVKQSNLIKYFNLLYPENKFESSRTFMTKLRKIDDDFFKAKNAKAYSAGKKYFPIS